MQGHLQEDELEKQLGLFKDEKGIIRCRGRLGNSQASYDTKFPALLSRNHHVTSLIIRYCHERVMHNGLKETLTEVRSKYWIPKGRQTVKKELFGCNICRRFQGRSYPVPESPDLPEFRVRDVHAFSCVGVDFAGPLFVKSKVKDDPEMTKVYIALFTCATSRVVHLELVSSLGSPTFLLCLGRFTGRRGLPKLIVSDNAKTFQASEKTLVSLFELEDVQKHLSSKGIRWQFNLAKAPWWGGFFERLVKQVKSCLKKTLGRSKLSFDELTTILVEVEAVLNSRPLTYLYSEEPLPVGLLQIDDWRFLDFGDHLTATKRSRYLTDRIQHFRRRWQQEYLVELREFHHPKGKNVKLPPVRINDVVILHDQGTSQRAFWKLARITDLIKGRDEKVRGARVLVAGKKTLIERPLQELFPLEVHASNTESTNPNSITEDEPCGVNDGVSATQTRPCRTAAVVAEEKIKLIDHLLG